jgi:hypothetical protein
MSADPHPSALARGPAGAGDHAHFHPQLSDVVARIALLIDLFDAADCILARTLDASLSRAGGGAKFQGPG